MGRTRLFHTVVIVGSSLLASCDKGRPPTAPAATGSSARPTDAAVVLDAAPEMVRIMAEPPPPPRIHAVTPEKVGQPPPPPPRIQVRPPPHHLKKSPPPVRIMIAPGPKDDL